MEQKTEKVNWFCSRGCADLWHKAHRLQCLPPQQDNHMFLQRIVEQTRLDLEKRKQTHPLTEIQRLAIEQPPPRDMLKAFEPRSRVHLIAEVKRASPSKG